MIPVARPCFGAEEEAAVLEVLRSGWVAQGPTTALFEEEFARAVGTRHAIATSSCTTALHLAVIASGAGPGDEVILPSFTFPATANAVLYEGATPVLVDIDPDTLNIDPQAVEAALTDRTRAILGVHLFGAPCEIGRLAEIARVRGAFLIEDAACAIGTEIGGRAAGSFGDVACFSLHARKVTTCGEGGMITTDDDAIAERLRSLCNHGADRSAAARHAEGAAPAVVQYTQLGYNYRLSDVQAAIGRVQLGRLESFVEERGRIAVAYEAALSGLTGLHLPRRPADGRHSWQSYVVSLGEDSPIAPEAFMATLADRGVSTRIGTYAVHREPYFRERFGTLSLPASDAAFLRSVALPIFNGMPDESVEEVIASIRAIWEANSVTH